MSEKQEKEKATDYSEFEKELYYVLECPYCGNGFLTETLVREEKSGEHESYYEPGKGDSFKAFCPRCGIVVTGLALEKVCIKIFEIRQDDDTED